jgi:uncharacterized protein
MNFMQLALIVTDDCNFHCSYCPQRKEDIYMKHSTIKKAVDFFYPFLEEEAVITFYGGEPLLAFDSIRYAVSLLEEKEKKEGKKLRFNLTTNGSLITDEVLRFFNEHHFDVQLSFDGLTQDMSRKPGSLVPTRELARRMQGDDYPDIIFSTHSVFSPETVSYLSDSLRSIIESGVENIGFSVARNTPWDDSALSVLEKEMAESTAFLVSYYHKTGRMPVKKFRQKPADTGGNFPLACAAGRRFIAVTPAEDVWGCIAFHDCLKNREQNPDFHRYGFGKLDGFTENYKEIYPRIIDNYRILRQDYFFSENQHCSHCEEVNDCFVCPASSAYATSLVGKLAPWVCRLTKIQRKENKRYFEEMNKINTMEV